MEDTIRQLLTRLESCTSIEFSVMVQLYIDHIVENVDLKPGGGWLVFCDGKPYLIEVSAHSPAEEQLLTFVHEVFHIPFVQRLILDLEDQRLHTLLEEGIDKVAELFFQNNVVLVSELYSALKRP